MGTVKNFEDLEIWRISRELVNQIYSDFRECKDYGFKDQITRAGISVMNNISEGFCRDSDAEFRHFLNISKGSCGEIKSMYYIAEDQFYVDLNNSINRRDRTQRLIYSISSFMRYLKTSSKSK
jgi:four helix bundle protein